MHRLASLALILVIAASACGESAPQLLHDDTVPDDLRALADETWADLLAALPARHGCIDEPTLHAAWELDTRAEYHPSTATLAVRVPGTPATLRSELIHEFAHHIEFTCGDHEDLRTEFIDAQGLAPGTGWFDGPSWETTPSEQYAEAMVELVEGRRTYRGGIKITDEAVAVVRDWGKGP